MVPHYVSRQKSHQEIHVTGHGLQGRKTKWIFQILVTMIHFSFWTSGGTWGGSCGLWRPCVWLETMCRLLLKNLDQPSG